MTAPLPLVDEKSFLQQVALASERQRHLPVMGLIHHGLRWNASRMTAPTVRNRIMTSSHNDQPSM